MEQTGITNLVIGHNRDDLAETFLMRLIRGAGLEGLACMSGLDEHENFLIYRPLLRTGREEIRNVLRSAGIHWREDSSNGSNDYLRNRIRNSLIPVMNEMAEGAVNRIAQTAEILNLENQTLQEYADFYLAQHSSGSWLDFRAVQGIPQALQRRVLRNWWKMNRPETEEHSLNARQTESLVKLLNSERGKVNLPGGLIAVKGRHGMYLTGMPKRQIQEITFRPRIQEQICFGDFRLTILPSEGNPGNGTCTQEVPEKFFADCVIRTRKAGDRIRPFGMKGIRKLQDYLTDRRIDEPIRDEIPLICRGNEVLMVAGVGTGAVPIWNASEKNIRLKWQGRMPWDTDERSEKDNGSKE
jgi:tRNA(Ile)-lysidine synthase